MYVGYVVSVGFYVDHNPDLEKIKPWMTVMLLAALFVLILQLYLIYRPVVWSIPVRSTYICALVSGEPGHEY